MSAPIDEKPDAKLARVARERNLRQVALSMAVGPRGTMESPVAVTGRAEAYFQWLKTEEPEQR